tara:strand:- start:1830 stop:2939 length:1110 start_codon:yes stop_codon:yes gene_type:complete
MKDDFEITFSMSEKFSYKWDNLLSDENPFIKSTFLKSFEIYDNESLTPYYIKFNESIIYGNLITIIGSKVANYVEQNKKFSLKRWLMRKVNVRVFCFGNTHMSNLPSHLLKNHTISEEKLLQLTLKIKKNYGVNYFLLPDHFFLNVEQNDNLISNKFNLFNIDPDMRLKIPKQWNSFEDYIDTISSKYKKRHRGVIKKNKDLTVKNISIEELDNLKDKMKELYNNVYEKSSFSGPPFKLNIFNEIMQLDYLNPQIKGYFLNDNLIAFSSYLSYKDKLYSYYIGLDYSFNKKYAVYSKILYDTIEKGIKEGNNEIIFGRTASEFKSTFGAKPINSKSGLIVMNSLLNLILKPFLKQISPEKWIKRSPFKS